MAADRDQHYWHAATPREWQNSDSPYELVTVCFWSIVVVSLASLLMWLALGGQSSLTASRSLNATGAQHAAPGANGGVGAARASLAGVTDVEPALDAFGQARPSRTRLDPPCGSPGKIDRTAKPFGASAKSNCDLQPWR